MNDSTMYDQFSRNYDHFVNWSTRLSAEIPFLTSELTTLTPQKAGSVSILDAACGTGRHVIALADQGFSCAGADFSAGMVDVARQNVAQTEHEITIKQAGFGGLSEAFGYRAFDGLICLGNSLPHVLDELTLNDALLDFRSVLRKDGKLIIQNRNFDKVLDEHLRWMAPQTFRDQNNTWVFARFYDFDPDGRITFNIQILNSQAGSDFEQHVVSTRLWPIKEQTLAQFLNEAGFKDITYYGNLEGERFQAKESGNLVIVARAD